MTTSAGPQGNKKGERPSTSARPKSKSKATKQHAKKTANGQARPEETAKKDAPVWFPDLDIDQVAVLLGSKANAEGYIWFKNPINDDGGYNGCGLHADIDKPYGFNVYIKHGKNREEIENFIIDTFNLSETIGRPLTKKEKEEHRLRMKERVSAWRRDQNYKLGAAMVEWWETDADFNPSQLAVEGGPIDDYLASRGLKLHNRSVVRYSPAFDFDANSRVLPEDRHFVTPAAMVALTYDAETGVAVGVHVTYLNKRNRNFEHHGSKKITLAANIGVIKWRVVEGPRVLVIAEGGETALSAMRDPAFDGASIWSTSTALGMRCLPPLPDFDKLFIIVDKDEPQEGETEGEGEKSAEVCASNWRKAGKEVRLIMPVLPQGETKIDLNDVVRDKAWTPGGGYTNTEYKTPNEKLGYVSHGDYEMGGDGLFIKLRAPNGFVFGRAQLSGAFKVIGQFRDMNNVGWGVQMEFIDPDGVVKREHYHAADMHNVVDSVTGKLADAGLVIMPKMRNLVRDYIGGVIGRITKRFRAVAETGWHDSAFVLPNETIGDIGGEEPLLVNSGAHRYAQAGALAEWKAGPAKIAEPHRLARLAISTALSGPMLNLVHGESGGLHFKGESSTGKSSEEWAAASVWGNGTVKNGYVQSWHNTANAFEGVAAMASDTFLALDELSQANAADVEKTVYMFGNDGGKGRMNADTSMRAIRTWRIAILSSGEKTIAEKIAENRGLKAPAGVEMRLVNVSADAGKGFGAFDTIDGYKIGGELADALKKESVTHYGVAGPAFLRAIIEHGVDKVRVKANAMVEDFVKQNSPEKASGQAQRVAKRFAVISTAGELAIEYEVLPWPKGHAEKAAAWAFKRWIADTGAEVGVIEDRQAVEQIRRLIEMYGDSRFDDIYVRSDSPRPKPANDPNDHDAVGDTDETPLHDQHDDERPVFTRYGFRRGKEEKEWLVTPQVGSRAGSRPPPPVALQLFEPLQNFLQRGRLNQRVPELRVFGSLGTADLASRGAIEDARQSLRGVMRRSHARNIQADQPAARQRQQALDA